MGPLGHGRLRTPIGEYGSSTLPNHDYCVGLHSTPFFGVDGRLDDTCLTSP